MFRNIDIYALIYVVGLYLIQSDIVASSLDYTCTRGIIYIRLQQTRV